MKEIIRIGIDPDLDKSGYCMVVKEPFGKQHVTFLKTETFFKLCESIKRKYSQSMELGSQSFIVRIEAGWLNKISNYHSSVNKAVAGRIGKNVGENHAVGKLIMQYCEENEIPYKLIKPESKKWDAKLFKQITGWTSRTNQEERDAVRAAWY
jgi:hypothetical protein